MFDPNTYNTNGTTAIDWYVPSPDGRVVAITLSEGGSEQGTLHFFEVESGRKLADEIPRVQYPTGGGSAAWTAGGAGILYTRYPHQGERPAADVNFYQQVWFHRLGTPVADDQYAMGKDFPRIAEIDLETSEDGQWVLATVANGDGGDFAHYLRNAAGDWRQLTRFEDGIKRVKFGRDGALYSAFAEGRPARESAAPAAGHAGPREGYGGRAAEPGDGAGVRSVRSRSVCLLPTGRPVRAALLPARAAPGPAKSPSRRCQPCRGWTPGGGMIWCLVM